MPARARWPVWSTAAATIMAVAVIAFMMLPARSPGWADVSRAINAQKSIRLRDTNPADPVTIWLSPQRRVWACKQAYQIQFLDGRQQAKYEYRTDAKRITKTPLGEEDERRVFPGDDLSRHDALVSPWLVGPQRLLETKRCEVTEGGKTWIEFQLALSHISIYHGTLRVDPQTKLPVSLVFTSPTDPTMHAKWEFDYPADGPADVYALGVPVNAKFDDRVPSGEGLRALDGMAASRARIGDFRLDFAASPLVCMYTVWRKGNRWRIDECTPRGGFTPPPKPAQEQDLGNWFDKQLARCEKVPIYLSDGTTVYCRGPRATETPNAKPALWNPCPLLTPQDLLSGQQYGPRLVPPQLRFASTVYPSLLDRPGLKFAADLKPADAPGCVVFKLSARIATQIPTDGNEWYYVDPAKGDAVVRIKRFNSPADKPANPASDHTCNTVQMEGLRRSPQGFWYPTAIHETMFGFTGPFDSKDMVAASLGLKKAEVIETTDRFHFDFAAPLPDSLFTIDTAAATAKKPHDE